MINEILGYKGDAPEEYIVTIENTTDYSGQRGLANIAGKSFGLAGAVVGGAKKVADYAYKIINPDAQSGVIDGKEAPGQKYHVVIKALVQDDISFNTEALWSPSAAVSVIRQTSGQTMELLTGRTLVNRFVSRKMWGGTTPLDFTLNLRFGSIENNFRDVVWPCVELQRMILPSSGGRNTIGEWFLLPPGPNPFYIKAIKSMQEGEIINVRIGKFINVKKVVLKSMSLKFSPHFLEGGAPLSILATINFSAFDIFTKETLQQDMYDTNSIGDLSYKTENVVNEGL